MVIRMMATLLALLLAAAGLTPVMAAEKKEGSGALERVAGSPIKTYLNINNISTVFWNNGYSDIDVQDQNSGFVFPKGSRKTAVFKSGFVWGAHYGAGGEVRVGGSDYRSGLQAGKLLPGGAEDPDLPKNRIYRVRPDIPPTVERTKVDVSSEVADEGVSSDEVIDQYVADWNEWPAADGAPFVDMNGNGIYEPAGDIPGVRGADQTVWYVVNDQNPTNTTYMYGSNPLGIELQVTVWAYKQAGALGNMYFRKYMIINRSTVTFDSMYVTQWSDPDLGNSGDDFVGVDTTRSLGYCYNANATDATYDPLPPPAVGFDFFQGPVVSGGATDSAIFRGQRIHGRRNLPATAFYYFARGDATVTDPTLGSYEGTIQFYNFMQGRIGRTGNIFTDPAGNQTTFALAGDPQTRQGWVDGQIIPADDRRMGLASGPFTMAPGDTQEVVVAEVAAGAIPGTDRLSAIGLLKFYDDIAQLAYNNFFDLAVPPPTPVVNISRLDREIVLNWGADLETADKVETSGSKGYAFQGYNVYQLPTQSSTIAEARRLVTYDIVDGVGKIEDYYFDPNSGVVGRKVIQFGNDTGLKRYLAITTDALGGSGPLINGIRYYYAVTAYSYNPDPSAVPNNLETPLVIYTVVPQTPNPGTRYPLGTGDTLQVTQSTAPGGSPSDGSVLPLVVDPAALNGHSYRVRFEEVEGEIRWTLTDMTASRDIVTGQQNQTGDEDYVIVDGLQVKVLGPPPGMKDYDIPNGTRHWTWSGADGFQLEGFNGAMGNALDFWGVGVSYDRLRNVLIRFAATDADGNLLDQSDTLASYAYRYLRAAQNPAAKPEFQAFIKNTSASYDFQDYVKGVPFAVYNVETEPPTRLAVGFLENNVENGLVDGKLWPPINPTDNTTSGTSPREWLWIFDSPYTGETSNPAFETNLSDDETLPLMWVSLADRRSSAPVYEAGSEFLLLANHINSAANTFDFTAPTAIVGSEDLARSDVTAITVFPNPYYGVNTEELNKYQRFVTFSHMPAKATVRIFNLAGLMVRKLDKDDPGQFLRWDLSNDSGLPVGSGLFIAHIEMPELGATKIVKLAIVQEQQILDRY